MKIIEKFVNEHVNDAYTIENLPERMDDVYTDYDYKGKHNIQMFNRIAEDLSTKFSGFTFCEDALDASHPNLYCDDKLSKKLGVDNIILCPYKGYENDNWLFRYESNYILMIFPKQEEENSRSTLYIDLYNTYHKGKEEIYQLIIQELYNLKRDVEWANKGIYDKMMEKLSRQSLEMENRKMMEDPLFREIFEDLNNVKKKKDGI